MTSEQLALACAAAEIDTLAQQCGCAAHLGLQPTDDGGMKIKLSVKNYGDVARFTRESGAIFRKYGLDPKKIGTA